MQANFSLYNHKDGFLRIDEMLNSGDNEYEEVDSIPSRDRLSFNNGFYVNCSAVFVDIRDSSKLPEKYTRPTLAKIYRAFISETVAVMNGNPDCAEVNIVGDAVSGIFDTPYLRDINYLFGMAAKINALISVLNCKLQKRRIDPIRVGIGMSYGRALMIKAGHKGSSVNDVVWLGDVVNEASHLSNYGSSYWNIPPIMMSSVFRENLNDENKAMTNLSYQHNCYSSNVVNSAMYEWYEANCNGY